MWRQKTLIISSLSPKRELGPKRVNLIPKSLCKIGGCGTDSLSWGALNPFRTAVPFLGQTSQNSSSLSPKRDCGSKGVNSGYIPTTAVQVLPKALHGATQLAQD